MIQIVFGVLCAFISGMFFAIPMGMSISAKMNVLWALPLACVFMAGIATCAYYFFAPGAAFYVSPR